MIPRCGPHRIPPRRGRRCTRTFKGPLPPLNTGILTRVGPGNCDCLGGDGSRYLGCVVAEIRELACLACLAVWLPSFALIIPLPGRAFATRLFSPDGDVSPLSTPSHQCCNSDNLSAFSLSGVQMSCDKCTCVIKRVSRACFKSSSCLFCFFFHPLPNCM